ncbi:MAG TPA: glycosyltransferase family 1 protein [Pyrinomonadaceae bacterium]|nr:glycosyltransferase family 1 protein [Pyrinomonadaceae bacterium]
MKKKLRIAINAQIPLGSGTGGIETVLRALASAGRLDDGDEEYVFIGHWSDPDWLKPFLGERQTIVSAPRPKENKPAAAEIFKRSLGRLRPLAGKVRRAFAPPQSSAPPPLICVPVSDGFYESLGCDVIHFPYQDYVYCNVPTVYNPHDLQHLHYPEFFPPEEIERREIVYPAACRAADMVVVASEFVKQDVVRNYDLAEDKVRVIAWSPPEINSEKFPEDEARLLPVKYELPAAPFALYPAMTWEHKNHIRLLEAVALLRERESLRVNLVCTGHKNAFWSQIERRLRELKLEEQVKFLGVVTHRELSALYLQAQFVVIPTLFEAASAPLFEAWQHNAAAACSSVTSLPEQAAGAALLFNPFSVEEIAVALKRMAADEGLRRALREKGTRRLADFSLERTARAYRAVYRKVADVGLSDDDLDILEI